MPSPLPVDFADAALRLWLLLLQLEVFKYASIPLIAGLVGWSTNWVAIQLTFRPLRFVGWPPWLGWQGIIPAKAGKMAAIFVDTTMVRLGTLPELFQRMEPDKISQQIIASMTPRLSDLTDRVLGQADTVLWQNTPDLVKQQVYRRVEDSLPDLVDNLMQDASQRIEELIDFKHMISTRLVDDPALLNRLFLESGAEEFKFIVRSGFYFGFLFGLVQLLVWILYPVWWVLPLFGLVVGYATNWIALNVIFRPLEPRQVGPWTLHGIFLRRQREVARIWCRLVTREIVTVRSMIHAMMYGPKSDATRAMIRRHIEPIVWRAAGPIKLPAQLAIGPQKMERMAQHVGDVSVTVSTDPFDDWHFNRDRSAIVEELLRKRMEELPSEEFQDLLRPCFQEDEMKLILMGAGLGLLAGVAQLIFVFGGG